MWMTLDEYAFQELVEENEELKNRNDILEYRNGYLEEEYKRLKEFKEKRDESMFYFKAQIERAEPKTSREAEDLQRAKKIFEKLYRKELICLEEENRKLKKENKGLKADYIKLSKIVETTWGYKASYVNELRDKIAKLEKKLKTVTEGEIIIPIYDEEGKLLWNDR